MGQQGMREGTQAMFADADLVMQKDDELNELRISNALKTSKTMLLSMRGFNKSWFDAVKALGVAEAIVNTYNAATAALKIQPPALGISLAAMITGLGMANVARIKAQKYQAKEMGGTVRSGQPYIVGEAGAELFTPGQTGSITPNNAMGGGANINFTINAVDAKDLDQLLYDRRAMIMSLVGKAMKEVGAQRL